MTIKAFEDTLIITFNSEEEKTLLNYYSNYHGIAEGLRKVLVPWINARVKQFSEEEDQRVIQKFKDLSLEDKNRVLRIMGESSGT